MIFGQLLVAARHEKAVYGKVNILRIVPRKLRIHGVRLPIRPIHWQLIEEKT